MKELSIEEKAQRYDEAIEKFDVILNLNTVKESGTIFADDVRKIFPELKESEDERMVKFIKNQLFNIKKTITENYELDVKLTKAIDWLEKQRDKDKLIQELGEYKVKYIQETLEKASTMNNKDNERIKKTISDILLIDSDEIREILDANNVLMQDIDTWLEKQGGQTDNLTQQEAMDIAVAKCFNEQKTADKIEPKFKVGDWIVHQGTENIYQVVACVDNHYELKYGDNYTVQKCADVDKCARLLGR